MSVVAVYSLKGGVGKSTIAANLAWCSATILCRHTLLWDLDPSGGGSYLLGAEPRAGRTAARSFTHKADPNALVLASRYERLSVLPADESLRQLDSLLLGLQKRRRLAKLLAAMSTRYERFILDCPPVLNEVSAQVIRAADVVVVPLTPSGLSLRALEAIRDDLAANHRRHPPILPVLSMFDARRSLHRAVQEEHADWPIIPMASAIEQMASRCAPIGAYAPRSPGARAFAALWQGIEHKLAELQKRHAEGR